MPAWVSVIELFRIRSSGGVGQQVFVEEARPTGGKLGAALEEMRAVKPQVRGTKSPADTSSEDAVCTVGSLPRKRRAGVGQQ